MSYTQKYCLVSFVQPLTVGTLFDMSGWPPHLTLAPVFRLDDPMLAYDELLACSAVTGQTSMLGTTKVILVEPNSQLLELHASLMDKLEAQGAKFNDPQFTRDGYIPHISIQDDDIPAPGTKLNIATISLIDMFPDSNWQKRQVLKTFKLSQRG